MLNKWAQKQGGFTIVELLIVVVVIAILATISIVAYTNIQNRANDAAIQSDVRSIAKQFDLYKVENGVYPAGATQLGTFNFKVAKGSYGSGFASNAHNLLYCRVVADGPNKFALMASSKSGTLFVYKSETGSFSTLSSWPSGGSTGNCQNVGINQVDSNDRDVFYINNAWASYVSG
jgi:prepilin-type N-terminal cleavage/methylation domain-containing protein